MIDVNLVILLLAAISLLAGVAARTGTPYPVVLVLGGLVIGEIPGLPAARLQPDLVLVLFLPPLIYSSAFLSSIEELRANAWPVLLLAVGLVLATVAGVAAVAALVVGLPWAVAFVLGGVLGPTDPVSASAILQRLGAPERIVTILEGESLVNDATAITAYAIAITAVETGRFDALNAVGTFAFEVAAGAAIGLAAAWLATQARRFVDGGGETALTLLTPFIAYIPADAVGASGVLAAVAAGLYAATRQSEVTTADSRLTLRAFWRVLVFLLNGILFLLIGLELPDVVDQISGGIDATLLWHAVAIALTVMVIRLLWMFVTPMVASALRRGRDSTPAGFGARLVLGWSGMRGAVSLAIALAIPLTVAPGRAFPDRAPVVFFAYVAVLLTLVAPGFTLGPLIRRLGLQEGPERVGKLAEARSRVLHAAMEEIDSQAAAEQIGDDLAERLRSVYEARLDRLDQRLTGDRDGGREEGSKRLRRAVIAAERRRLDELRAERAYPADLLGEIARDLDIEDARLR